MAFDFGLAFGTCASLPLALVEQKHTALRSAANGSALLDDDGLHGRVLRKMVGAVTPYDNIVLALTESGGAGDMGRTLIRLSLTIALLRVPLLLMSRGEVNAASWAFAAGCVASAEQCVPVAWSGLGDRSKSFLSHMAFLASQTRRPRRWSSADWTRHVETEPEGMAVAAGTLALVELFGGGAEARVIRQLWTHLAGAKTAEAELRDWKRGLVVGRPTALRGEAAEHFGATRPKLEAVATHLYGSPTTFFLSGELRTRLDLIAQARTPFPAVEDICSRVRLRADETLARLQAIQAELGVPLLDANEPANGLPGA